MGDGQQEGITVLLVIIRPCRIPVICQEAFVNTPDMGIILLCNSYIQFGTVTSFHKLIQSVASPGAE